MNPWSDYDAWEARDRTLLESAAHARERIEWSGGWVPPPHWQNLGALDSVLATRYPSHPPDEERD